jgi:hypothetical protein
MKRKPRNVQCDIESFELALRVLSAWNNRRTPAESDVAALRNAFPSFTFESPDDLACQAIDELRPHVLRRPPKRKPIISRAAKIVLDSGSHRAAG